MNFKAITMSVLLLASAPSMAASFGYTVFAPFASTMTTSGVNAKEQEAIIINDALDFLAGSEASEILLETISKMREISIEVQELTDEEIAQLIVTQ